MNLLVMMKILNSGLLGSGLTYFYQSNLTPSCVLPVIWYNPIKAGDVNDTRNLLE